MSISLLDDILARIQELTPEARKELDQTIAQGTAGLRWIPNPGPQTMAYHSPADELYYGGQAGGGKGLRKCNPVLTPFGWRPIGRLRVGDALCATDGSVQKVIGVYDRGPQPIYRLKWSDGSETTCDADHIWLGWRTGLSRKAENERLSGQEAARKWTTREIAEAYGKGAGADGRMHRLAIPVMSAPARFNVAGQQKGRDKHISRALPPYVLGVLLGDGYLGETGVSWSKPDTEIADRVDELMASMLGEDALVSRYKTGKHPQYRIPNRFCMEHLEELGLLGCLASEKFIPRIYLLATVEDRWELLRGLMDTDGWAEEDGDCYYGSVSKQLAEDVRHLARSLGAIVHWREKDPEYSYLGETRSGQHFYTLRIKLPSPERMFTLDRKADRCRGKEPQSMALFLESIESVGVEDTVCIAVSHPNSLFVIDDFIVTHNSDLLLGLALNEHTVSRIFRRQHNDRQALIDRMSQILGTRDGYNGSDHVWRVPGTEKIVRFGALSDPNAWERYQGDPTDLKGWDEITQFRQHEYVTVNAWLRTTIKGQRTRIVAAGNPPLTPEALWVIEYWAPWLDPRHQNPAKDGELRWFTTIDGESVEVDADWRGVGPSGEEIKPKSRTFIRASVSDNPDMVEAGYSSTLANLPKHLREALLEGKFNASLEDDAWQVIPTEWVLAAQQRWEQRKHEERGPMTAVGVDPSGGGADRTVLVPCWGNYIGEPVIEQGLDLKNPRVIAAAIIKVTKDNPQLNIDCTGGWGAGPAEHLESNGFEVVRCIFSAGSMQRSRCRLFGFANKRAEYYWQAREALDPDSGDDICLPPGRRVIAELTAARYSLRNRKDILIEPKEDVKARLGESPDIGDAIVLALAETGATRRTRTTKGMDGKAFASVAAGPKINLSYGRSSVAPIKKKGW